MPAEGGEGAGGRASILSVMPNMAPDRKTVRIEFNCFIYTEVSYKYICFLI